MMMNDVLVAIISGKRPGGKKARPTEKLSSQLVRVIISNNDDGYVTDIPIVMVPDDYREWYIANHKNSDNAWYAPMNRSYAIKWARERGYRYLVQMDDNILSLDITFLESTGNGARRFRAQHLDALDDFCGMYKTVLQNTNAAMVGCQLSGTAIPENTLWREGYCYSFFMLALNRCPDVFQGDFEDDIEYRLKCAQIGRPVIQLPWMMYGKTGQGKNTDLSGCRAEYAKQGLKRGAHMSVLYGDTYSCKMTHKRHTTVAKTENDALYFKHLLKPFRVGVIVKDADAIRDQARMMFSKYRKRQADKCVVKVKRG